MPHQAGRATTRGGRGPLEAGSSGPAVADDGSRQADLMCEASAAAWVLGYATAVNLGDAGAWEIEARAWESYNATCVARDTRPRKRLRRPWSFVARQLVQRPAAPLIRQRHPWSFVARQLRRVSGPAGPAAGAPGER